MMKIINHPLFFFIRLRSASISITYMSQIRFNCSASLLRTCVCHCKSLHTISCCFVCFKMQTLKESIAIVVVVLLVEKHVS